MQAKVNPLARAIQGPAKPVPKAAHPIRNLKHYAHPPRVKGK